MEKITLYKDKDEVFTCGITLEGTNPSEARARLVLSFENGPSYMFIGLIDENNMCSISIPKLRNAPKNVGRATLEVIAESAFFEPWTGNFEIKNQKTVKVESVRVSSAKPNVEVTRLHKQPSSRIFTEVASTADRKVVNAAMKSFSGKSKKMKTELQDYEPVKKISRWGKKVFRNPQSFGAMYCMMVLEDKLKKS